MKAADREHKCPTRAGKPGRDYRIMRNIGLGGWSIWIPDFLREENTLVVASVVEVAYCPFCGVILSNDKNSEPV